ncbi:hypothetical protein [Streptomyces kronopolitis]|uniref:hypothetical protein n=1 Tax=Streptomyces kronopolitis TaxID=1612435 RepID=UPI0020BDBF9D|nr:hypothetical protein [Streptomyces kronopolitis]MCL6302852.1 hypothetical protein [Streptomyces kronopolitis]
MPLDDDVNQALFHLHFGFNAPLWGKAIRLQVSRLRPIEDLAVQVIAADRAIKAGTASEDQLALSHELDAAREENPDFDCEFQVHIHPTASAEAAFLVIAMRGLLQSAERMVKQLAPLGKEATIKNAVDTFKRTQPHVTLFRDVLIHNDEYSTGEGRCKNKAIAPNQGMGVVQDDVGRILVTWGGHAMPLLQAADEALALRRTLNQEYWGKLTA